MSLFEQLKNLYNNSLHSNVITLSSFILSVAENLQDASITPPIHYQTMVYAGKSLQYQGEHRRAEAMFKKALQFVKVATKNKSIKSSEFFKDGNTEIDVKFAIAECNMAVREFRHAVSTLESIPQRHRTPKVNMTLGKLYQQGGMERPAIVAYKDVLKECPLALEAIQELLSLGVRGAEVSSMMINFPCNSPTTEWVSQWIKGHAHLYSREYVPAINYFKRLEESSPIRKNAIVLGTLGETCYLAGDCRTALTVLQRAQATDPRCLRGVDLLASLLADERRMCDLSALCRTATAAGEGAPQPWIAVGHYCRITKRTTKAINFAHKACSLNPRSVEGLLLKGNLLLELKKVQEASMHFREALQIAPYRFEPHKGLVDCYVARRRLRDAAAFAATACKLLDQSPRALTLCASVLVREASTAAKGRAYLERALKQDQFHLPAVYLLCDIFVQEMRYDLAIELLSRQTASGSRSAGGARVHHLLSECHAHLHHVDKAAHHFNVALILKEELGGSGIGGGIEGPTGRVDTTPDVATPMHVDGVEEIADSDGDVEESDLEAVWSDVDFSFNAQ